MELVEAMKLIGPADDSDADRNAQVRRAALVLIDELRRLARKVHVSGFPLAGSDAQDDAIQKVMKRLSRVARGGSDATGRAWERNEQVTAYLTTALKNHIRDLGRTRQREQRRLEMPPPPVTTNEPEFELKDVQRVLGVAMAEVIRSNPREVSDTVQESFEDMLRLQQGRVSLQALAVERSCSADGLYQRHHRARERVLKAGRRCRPLKRLTEDDLAVLGKWVTWLKRRKVRP